VPSELAHVGYGNFLIVDRIQAVLPPTAAPVQRLIREAREESVVIDVTSGRRTRAVAVLDTGKVVLLGLSLKELAKRGLPTGAGSRRRRKRAR
jgi:regulator of extracellular matrix RemA (YlzA/DUF370 family)